MKRCGSIKIHPVKSRIAFMVRMRFSGVSKIGKGYIDIEFISRRKVESSRFSKYEFIPPNYHLYYLRISSTGELDDELFAWTKEAYSLGTQERLLRKKVK